MIALVAAFQCPVCKAEGLLDAQTDCDSTIAITVCNKPQPVCYVAQRIMVSDKIEVFCDCGGKHELELQKQHCLHAKTCTATATCEESKCIVPLPGKQFLRNIVSHAICGPRSP